jgi:glutamate 5-kinase
MRIVLKIGTSSLTDDGGVLIPSVIASVADQIAELRSSGHEVLLVTSGAVASGVAGLGLRARPSDTLSLQALSAVGQPQLMAAYNRELARHQLVGAQVLLVPNDFVDRNQYLHAKNTLMRLIELGCVPIINENDAIANNEIRYGDNDHLAALLSHLVSADMLLLLTDTDGLYTADPNADSSATLVALVAADDPLMSVDAGGSGTSRGSGGMASKLAAARIASWSGVTAVIAAAQRAHVVRDVVAGESVGTRFAPHDRSLSARKLWIAFAADVVGSVTVDAGAAEALRTAGRSLLPAGVVAVDGSFGAGDVVDVTAPGGRVIARGMSTVDADDARSMQGKRTADIDGQRSTVIVHRDDLVVF